MTQAKQAALTAEDIMQRDVIVAYEGDSLQEAMQVMTENHVTGLPIEFALDETARTVTVPAGVRYGVLAVWLDERGWALRNMGSLPHINVGGAAATGTTIPSLPSPKEFVESAALRDVYFDFDRYDVRSGDKGTLDENAKWLQSNQSALLLIEGHADERGTNEYNLALGERRAKATRDYLVSVGIDAGRITVISYGEERPVCTEKNDACWAKNRRAHFLVKQ